MKGERLLLGNWKAERTSGGSSVIYTLVEGPLSYLRLRFSVDPVEQNTTLLLVTTDYIGRHPRLRGTLERWHARRDAMALRDGVLAALRTAGSEWTNAAAEIRNAERVPMRASARLFVLKRIWRAEVWNVSASGIALLIAGEREQQEDDARFLEDHGSQAVCEVEVALDGEYSRVKSLIKRVTTNADGILVGVQVLDQEHTKPLLQAALARPDSDAASR